MNTHDSLKFEAELGMGPEVEIESTADGVVVRIRPRAGTHVYVVCAPRLEGLPCDAVKCSEDEHSRVRVWPVQEFSR